VLLLACAVLIAGRANAADTQPYRVDFAPTGNDALDSTLKATSQLEALRTSAPVDPFGLLARARADINRLQTVLESFGYYQGSIAVTINGTPLDEPGLGNTLTALPNGSEARCKLSFELGPLYHLGRIDIDGSLPDKARNSLQLSSGAPAIASDVLAGGARVLTTLQNDGYAFAKVDPPIAYEDPDNRVLNLTFHVETGPQVAIGDIGITGLKRVHESFVRRRLLLHTGEPYSAAAVEKARADLLATGVFSTVVVRLGNEPDEEGRVPVTLRLQERLRHSFSLSAAYSTDLGGSGGVTWTDRNFRGNAEQLDIKANIINIGGNATQGLGYDTGIKYILPDVGHRDQSLQFAIGAIKQNLQAYDQEALTSGVTLSRKLSSLWTATAGVSAVHETITQETSTCGAQQNVCVYTLLAFPIAALYDSTNLASPLLDPTHGIRASFSLTPTLSYGTTNATFLIKQVSASTYFDLDRLLGTEAGRSVLAIRGIAGVATGATKLDLPPDQRFYAGGSGTVRGFRYQSIGPVLKDQNNNPTANPPIPAGGTSMTAVNVEYRQRWGRSLGFALFADAGEVSDGVSAVSGKYRIGAGAGARLYTPLGPLRFDVAVPVNRQPEDDAFEFYIGIGQAF
jgi:translocation and assembly module TamA